MISLRSGCFPELRGRSSRFRRKKPERKSGFFRGAGLASCRRHPPVGRSFLSGGGRSQGKRCGIPGRNLRCMVGSLFGASGPSGTVKTDSVIA